MLWPIVINCISELKESNSANYRIRCLFRKLSTVQECVSHKISTTCRSKGSHLYANGTLEAYRYLCGHINGRSIICQPPPPNALCIA